MTFALGTQFFIETHFITQHGLHILHLPPYFSQQALGDKRCFDNVQKSAIVSAEVLNEGGKGRSESLCN